MEIEPEVHRVEGQGVIPHVLVIAGDASVKCFCVSHTLQATAQSVDGIFLLPDLYIIASREAKRWLTEILTSEGAHASEFPTQLVETTSAVDATPGGLH